MDLAFTKNKQQSPRSQKHSQQLLLYNMHILHVFWSNRYTTWLMLILTSSFVCSIILRLYPVISNAPYYVILLSSKCSAAHLNVMSINNPHLESLGVWDSLYSIKSWLDPATKRIYITERDTFTTCDVTLAFWWPLTIADIHNRVPGRPFTLVLGCKCSSRPVQ